MTRPAISINADLGEGFGAWQIADDAALLQVVTDASLACGFHAGDPNIMRATCEAAAALGVTVGAQVGYPDLRGFGRHFIELEPSTIANDVLYQLGALSAFTGAVDLGIGYVKVHGALYHAAVARAPYAEAIVDAIARFQPGLRLLCQPGTLLAQTAVSAGCAVIREGYVDRAYADDGLLVARGTARAVLTDPVACAERAVRLATHGEVESASGTVIDVPVDSLCIHSDSPGAPALARAVRGALEDAGVALTSLA